MTVSPWVAPAYDFEYDANTVSATKTEGGVDTETTYEWDADNRLVAINIGDHRSEFTYDGMGRRVRIKEIEGSTVESDRFYLWSGMQIIASGPWSSPGIGNADKRYTPFGYVYGAGTSGATNCYYFKDHLGSVRGAVSKNGIECEYEYDAYGNPTGVGTGSGESDFLYTGHFYHRPSGLYLAPFRAYDPKFGRWLSREPFGLDGPNLYHYGFKDPVNMSDFTGLRARRIILFNPTDGDGQFVDSIPPGGVFISNLADLQWYLNHRIQNGDDVYLYGHGSIGNIRIGLDGSSSYGATDVYPDDLKINKNLPDSSFNFMSCNFALDQPITPMIDEFPDLYGPKWSDLFGGAIITGWTGKVHCGNSWLFGHYHVEGSGRWRTHTPPQKHQ